MRKSGLESRSLPLAAGRKTGSRPSLLPLLWHGEVDGLLTCVFKGREGKSCLSGGKFPNASAFKHDPCWSNVSEESRWSHGLRSFQLSLRRNMNQAVIMLKPGMIKKTGIMGVTERGDLKSEHFLLGENSRSPTELLVSLLVPAPVRPAFSAPDIGRYLTSVTPAKVLTAVCTVLFQRKRSTSSKASTPS